MHTFAFFQGHPVYNAYILMEKRSALSCRWPHWAGADPGFLNAGGGKKLYGAHQDP